MSRRVGVLGGTFDPIHCGHLDAGQAAASALSLTEMLVIPCHTPPHRPAPVASSYHRFAMVALAVAGRSGWQASDIEVVDNSPSFTSTTLARLHRLGYSPTELFFIVGADAFQEIGSWRDYPAILEQSHFVVISRRGSSVAELSRRMPALADRMKIDIHATSTGTTSIFLIGASTAEVSATAIRQHLLEGRSVSGLVPRTVQQHIEQHELYTRTAMGRRVEPMVSQSPAGRLHDHT